MTRGKKIWIDDYGKIVEEGNTNAKYQITLNGIYRRAWHDNHSYWYEVQQPAIIKEILMSELLEDDINEWKELNTLK